MEKFKLCKFVNSAVKIISRRFSSVDVGIQISIVGGGPAGFYAAQQLVKLMPTASVDIYERLPVPYGLVRYGVAPDHPEVKNVINTFTKTAKNPNVNFYGNVSLGKDISLNDLKNAYHVVLLTYGAEEDRKLGIPGEDLKNVISAREFVGWYNGVPENKNLQVDLDVENVAVVGQGNVAVDVARILLSPIDKLKETDITEYSLQRLSQSKVKKVSLIGRRGPLQVAFTIKELREMLNLPNVSTVYNPDDLIGVDKIIPSLVRPRKRLTELLYKSAVEEKKIQDKIFEIIFKRSPIRFSGGESVQNVEMVVNKLEGEDLEGQKAIPTDEKHSIQSGLVLRSIGYKSVQAEADIPFDNRKGVALNKNGKIAEGLYCSGWLATGPVGVILSTMTNAFSTAQLIHKDISDGSINVKNSKPGFVEISKKIQQKNVQVVKFADWEKIDKEEENRGMAKNKPREKIVTVEEMLKVAG